MKHFFLALLFTLAACSGGGPSAPGALSAAPVPVDPQQTGTVSALITGGFTLFNGSCGHVHVFTSGSTFTPTGYTPHVNDNVTVSYTTGSCATSITATNVTCNSGQCGGSGGNVATYKGCNVFTAGDYYNKDISTATVDANSSTIISGLTGNWTQAFQGASGTKEVEQVNVDPNTATLFTVATVSGGHNPPLYNETQMPWATGYFIEPLGDKHAMVLNTTTCKMYETYGTVFNGTTLSAYSGRSWDYTTALVQGSDGWNGPMASGLPFAAGMLKGEEASATINHALNFAGPYGAGVSQWGYLAPASASTASACSGNCTHPLHQGDHLRLKASYTCPTGAQAARVCAALKTYGMFYADQAGQPTLYFANSTDGTDPWLTSDVNTLTNNLHMTDFEVLTEGTLICRSGHSGCT